MKAYTMTTQKQVRSSFWDGFEQYGHLYRASKRQNEYPVDVRMDWCDYVDMLSRDGQISEALASRVTL